MTKTEAYAALDLDPSSSPEAAKKQYRKLAHQFHPDKEGGDEERFKKINEAYEIVSGKRASQNPNPFEQKGGFGGIDFESDFSDIFRHFAESRGHTQVPRPPTEDSEIGIGIEVSLSDIKSGKTFTVSYQQSKDCEKCQGVGGSNKRACPRCGGKGKIVYTNNQGGFIMQSVTTCSHCSGRGDQFESICDDCSGRGWKIYEKNISFEVKQKK